MLYVLRKRSVVAAAVIALGMGMVGAAAAPAETVGGKRHHRSHDRAAGRVHREPAIAQPPAAGQLDAANQEDASGPGGLPQRRNWGACGVGHWGAGCAR